MIKVGGITVPCPLCGDAIRCTVKATEVRDNQLVLTLMYDHTCRRNGLRHTNEEG